MEWGLDGIQLSDDVDAIVVTSEKGFAMSILEYIGFSFDQWYTSIINNMENKPYYDFYLQRDNFRVDLLEDGVDKTKYSRDYQGLNFNKEIIMTLLSKYSSNTKAKLNNVILTEDPLSAIAYCYNKNKRDSNGNVCSIGSDGTLNSENLKWFLPAIDEIEEIAKGAYDEFDRVFQNEKYWSCQPAFDRHNLQMPIIAIWNQGTIKADYYTDDLDRARATSVFTIDGTNYQNINSGVPGYAGTQNGRMNWTTPSFGDYVSNNLTEEDYKKTPGNLSRSSSCRIRAVYRSGTK